MKKILILFIFVITMSAKDIASNEVYASSILIQNHVDNLLTFYNIKPVDKSLLEHYKIVFTKIKPRNTWQKTYEILVKINMLRASHNLPKIEPVAIEAIANLNPDMVYEMNQRILTEIKIFEIRKDIEVPNFKEEKFVNKLVMDNYNVYVAISASLDALNKQELTPNYVYAQTMRIYDDITIIFDYLDITDETVPDSLIKDATPTDTLHLCMKILALLGSMQKDLAIEATDFLEFDKKDVRPSDIFTLTGLIISELQPIKAKLGLSDSITPAALAYTNKKPENVGQLMGWNLKRLILLNNLKKGVK